MILELVVLRTDYSWTQSTRQDQGRSFKNSDLCDAPSTTNSMPAMKLLSSDARNETAFEDSVRIAHGSYKIRLDPL
jgi:hypothetical protein